MKTMVRIFLILVLAICFGCATQGQSTSSSGGGSSSASAPSSSGKMLTDSDYKRIGVKETGNTVRR